MRLISTCFALAFVGCVITARPLAGEKDGLAGNTVLIIRHAEKPETGTGLTAQGEARARAYASYFEPFREGDLNFRVDALYAGADSKNSIRPRLTLEPLAHAAGLTLHSDIGTNDPDALVRELREKPHRKHPLIAWRHGQIPALLTSFGVSPQTLLPNGEWPDEVFDWVIVLEFNGDGRLVSQRLLHERPDIQRAK
ncbi:MAG TPA: hypothetical protein VHT24_06885 [Pseudacidobacterium sp.]|jgi:hypothetical protein|nr:hypothetical protein [Pseudacidobacterium sp.]